MSWGYKLGDTSMIKLVREQRVKGLIRVDDLHLMIRMKPFIDVDDESHNNGEVVTIGAQHLV